MMLVKRLKMADSERVKIFLIKDLYLNSKYLCKLKSFESFYEFYTYVFPVFVYVFIKYQIYIRLFLDVNPFTVRFLKF
jgi:hypothetical protein